MIASRRDTRTKITQLPGEGTNLTFDPTFKKVKSLKAVIICYCGIFYLFLYHPTASLQQPTQLNVLVQCIARQFVRIMKSKYDQTPPNIVSSLQLLSMLYG